MTYQADTGGYGLGYLLNNFQRDVTGTRVVIAVASDGLLIAQSDGMSGPACETLAAIASSAVGLGEATALHYDIGTMQRIILYSEHGILAIAGVSTTALIAVIAEETVDIRQLAFELARLAVQTADAITPELRGTG
jgi:predicted regulator of Ras-like GTPase activity (Roadblock/LC7/MglB family)